MNIPCVLRQDLQRLKSQEEWDSTVWNDRIEAHFVQYVQQFIASVI